jgi:predicted transcriptional regulator
MNNNCERNVVLTASCFKKLKEENLSKLENLVLWDIVTTLSPEGEVISNAELGRRLDVDTAHITRAMKNLWIFKFIMREAKIGVSYFYKLNPDYFEILPS